MNSGESRRVSRLRFCVCCAALLLSVHGAAPAVEELRANIVRPRHLSTVIGDTEIQVLVSVPEGAQVESLEIRVDGQTLTRLTAPPWIAAWDSGDASAGHHLSALVRLRDGRTAESSIRTSALRVNQVERVDLVNLYLVVHDRAENYITDLRQTDFRILEDGVAQTIERFSATHKPLRVAVVLDTSGSMLKGDKLGKAKKAALKFLEVLKPGDEGMVVTFADDVNVSQPLTAHKRELSRAIEATEAKGGTALYDAIYKASRQLRNLDGRRVLVLLSDGEDMAANGLEPGSLHTLDESLEQALRSEVMVFSIGLGRDLDRQYVRRWGKLYGQSNLDTGTTLAAILRQVSDRTGGRMVSAVRASRLDSAFATIAEVLHHQYSLAYRSTNLRQDGKWREMQVNVPGRDLVVVTRQGYFAPRAGKEETARGGSR